MSRLLLLLLLLAPGFAVADDRQPSSLRLIDTGDAWLTEQELRHFVQLHERLCALESSLPSMVGPTFLSVIGTAGGVASVVILAVGLGIVVPLILAIASFVPLVIGVITLFTTGARIRALGLELTALRSEPALIRFIPF